MPNPDEIEGRRYDVDLLRVAALGLLIIYHISISFQPWSRMIYFPQNEDSLLEIWGVMSALNVWRIPILFLISGMGVCFAMRRRTRIQLLKERFKRIGLPLVFGSLTLAPLGLAFNQGYFGSPANYVPHTGHLWFLKNLLAYVVLLLPLYGFWAQYPESPFLGLIRTLCSLPGGIFLFSLPLVLESWLVQPQYFPEFAETAHGFWYGLLCFLTGFLFAQSGLVFWAQVSRLRFLSLALALSLASSRILFSSGTGQNFTLLGIESMGWMLALLGLAARYGNRSFPALASCSRAVFPIYILHMPVQFGWSHLILPLDISAWLKLFLMVVATFGTCVLIYRWVLLRLGRFQLLFGIQPSRR
ncbi:MAG: acyltransferase [Planctomycetes bacterium]|nr:acyltransferase [Planctomycetota bacterium]